MKKNNIRKGLIICVACLLLFILFPTVFSEFIEYPIEKGPYTVYIGGISRPFFWDPEIGFQIGPLCKYKYPYGPEYNLLNNSIFIVNGKIQKYEFPTQIGLNGLTGFVPAVNHLTIKTLTGGRIRIFGVCDVIYLWYGLENN